MTLRQKLGVPMMAGGEAPREEGERKTPFICHWIHLHMTQHALSGFSQSSKILFYAEKLHFKGAKFVESHSFDSEITVWGHFEKEEEEDTFGASINPSRVSISHNENNIYDAI